MTIPVWQLLQSSNQAQWRMQQVLEISSLLARVLCARGLDKPDDARAFLAPAPVSGLAAVLPGVPEAVRIIKRAKRLRKTIAVYGDYDADGVIATAVLRAALGRFGCRSRASDDGLVEYYIPHRSEEGYGLNLDAIEYLADKGVEVLITVDCGITSHPEIKRARERGMEVVITDHHLLPDELPPADAIVHPDLGGLDAGSLAAPCGALVALGLAEGLIGQFEPGALDLTAVATVADVVPLAGVNRSVVYHQLKEMSSTPNEGLRALLSLAQLMERPLVARDLAFGIAPRINAMGRVGDAGLVVKALNTSLPVMAMEWATKMDQANTLRRCREEEVMSGAINQLGLAAQGASAPGHALVAAGTGWYLGVVGIVAGRLARRFRQPAAVIAVEDGVGHGSARSAPGIDLYQAVQACGGLLDRFGGHREAVGFRLPAERIDEFKSAFDDSVRAQGAPAVGLELDALVSLRELEEPAVTDLARLEPVGQRNPEARFCAADVQIVAARRVGRDSSHLKLKVRQGSVVKDAIAFGMAGALAGLCNPGQSVDLAFTPEINEYMGQRSVQLRVTAARPVEAALQVAAELDHDRQTGGETL